MASIPRAEWTPTNVNSLIRSYPSVQLVQVDAALLGLEVLISGPKLDTEN